MNVVYDGVGKTTFEAGFDCLRPRGYMVVFGQSSGKPPAVDPQTLNSKGSLFVTRPTITHYIADRSELLAGAADVLTAVRDGTLRLRIHHTYPLAQAGDAHRALEGRESTGKLSSRYDELRKAAMTTHDIGVELQRRFSISSSSVSPRWSIETWHSSRQSWPTT